MSVKQSLINTRARISFLGHGTQEINCKYMKTRKEEFPNIEENCNSMLMQLAEITQHQAANRNEATTNQATTLRRSHDSILDEETQHIVESQGRLQKEGLTNSDRKMKVVGDSNLHPSNDRFAARIVSDNLDSTLLLI